MSLQADQFGFYATLVLAFLLCLIYLGVGVRVLREDPVSGKVGQFYGYSVCLVAIIAFLVSTGSIAGAVMEWMDPLHAADDFSYPRRSLASFDTYKMDLLNPTYGGPQSDAPRYVPDDETLRRMLVTNGLTVLISIALFVTHWRWVRRQP